MPYTPQQVMECLGDFAIDLWGANKNNAALQQSLAALSGELAAAKKTPDVAKEVKKALDELDNSKAVQATLEAELDQHKADKSKLHVSYSELWEKHERLMDEHRVLRETFDEMKARPSTGTINQVEDVIRTVTKATRMLHIGDAKEQREAASLLEALLKRLELPETKKSA